MSAANNSSSPAASPAKAAVGVQGPSPLSSPAHAHVKSSSPSPSGSPAKDPPPTPRSSKHHCEEDDKYWNPSGRPLATVQMDDTRGMEPKEDLIHFMLASPLTASIVGAGYKGGQPILGVDLGPTAIREANVIKEVEELGWRVIDHGNLKFDAFENDPPTIGGIKSPLAVGGACKKVYDKVYEAAKRGHLPLTLGGDHSLAIGTISATSAAWNNKICVVWVDAHGDINSDKTSPTGNIHGMPVGFMMGLLQTEVTGFEWLKPCLKPEQIVYIGLRDVDPGEKKILRDLKIKCFSMTEVDRYGIGKVMEMALDHVNPKRDLAIHLSYDVDALDPLVVYSTGTRVRGGLTYREGCYICEALAETGRLVAVDLVEVNPTIGTPEQARETASVAVGLIKSALGQRLL